MFTQATVEKKTPTPLSLSGDKCVIRTIRYMRTTFPAMSSVTTGGAGQNHETEMRQHCAGDQTLFGASLWASGFVSRFVRPLKRPCDMLYPEVPSGDGSAEAPCDLFCREVLSDSNESAEAEGMPVPPLIFNARHRRRKQQHPIASCSPKRKKIDTVYRLAFEPFAMRDLSGKAPEAAAAASVVCDERGGEEQQRPPPPQAPAQDGLVWAIGQRGTITRTPQVLRLPTEQGAILPPPPFEGSFTFLLDISLLQYLNLIFRAPTFTSGDYAASHTNMIMLGNFLSARPGRGVPVLLRIFCGEVTSDMAKAVYKTLHTLYTATPTAPIFDPPLMSPAFLYVLEVFALMLIHMAGCRLSKATAPYELLSKLGESCPINAVLLTLLMAKERRMAAGTWRDAKIQTVLRLAELESDCEQYQVQARTMFEVAVDTWVTLLKQHELVGVVIVKAVELQLGYRNEYGQMSPELKVWVLTVHAAQRASLPAFFPFDVLLRNAAPLLALRQIAHILQSQSGERAIAGLMLAVLPNPALTEVSATLSPVGVALLHVLVGFLDGLTELCRDGMFHTQPPLPVARLAEMALLAAQKRPGCSTEASVKNIIYMVSCKLVDLRKWEDALLLITGHTATCHAECVMNNNSLINCLLSERLPLGIDLTELKLPARAPAHIHLCKAAAAAV